MTTQNQTTQPKIETQNLEGLNTSQKIRYLHAQGYARGDIARFLNKRYQHVRNVLVTPVKGA